MSLINTQKRIIKQIKRHRQTKLDQKMILVEFPAESGKMFSLSTESQDNWSKLAVLDLRGLVSYPFVVTTYRERDSYALTSSADLTSAIAAISAAVSAERSVAAGYIVAVLAATDEASARAAADPYLVWN